MSVCASFEPEPVVLPLTEWKLCAVGHIHTICDPICSIVNGTFISSCESSNTYGLSENFSIGSLLRANIFHVPMSKQFIISGGYSQMIRLERFPLVIVL